MFALNPKPSMLVAAALLALLPASASRAASAEDGTQTRLTAPTFTIAAAFKTPGRDSKRQCNGKTTTQCCEGLSFWGCLYMPGSDATHPTSCHSNPPPKPGRG